MARGFRLGHDSRRKLLDDLFLDEEGVQRRRDHLLQMVKNERALRQNQRENVSESDDERDNARVAAQLEGMVANFKVNKRNKIAGQIFLDEAGVSARRLHFSKNLHRDKTEQGTSIGLRKQVEFRLTHSLFGRHRQRMFWEIRNQRRRRREAENEVVSSDDDDRDLARVEAEIEGLARNQFRTHTDKELESSSTLMLFKNEANFSCRF